MGRSFLVLLADAVRDHRLTQQLVCRAIDHTFPTSCLWIYIPLNLEAQVSLGNRLNALPILCALHSFLRSLSILGKATRPLLTADENAY